MAGVGTAGLALGTSMIKPRDNGGNHDDYFLKLQVALKNTGLAKPTLIIDRGRLVENIQNVQQYLPSDMGFRIVTKSLPSIDLIDFILSKSNTRKLMVFHQPFLNQLVKKIAIEDAVLGKPMPVLAVARFYQKLQADELNVASNIQWLVDSLDRLKEYSSLAEQLRIKMKINLELDVGFHRGGFPDTEQVITALKIIDTNEYLQFAGYMGYDGHISIFGKYVGEADKALADTSEKYGKFITTAQEYYGDRWVKDDLTFNTGGSTTIKIYKEGQNVTPANDLAMGSGFIKPRFCDATMKDFQPAVFIASPVLKVSEGIKIPGRAYRASWYKMWNPNQAKSFFIYGGRWMAEPVSPTGLINNSVYGRSSNQDLFNGSESINLKAEDYIFFRPNQTEGVLLQFGDIAVYEDGQIVDFWPVLQDTGYEV